MTATPSPLVRPVPDLGTIRILIDHTDWSNDRLLDAAKPLSDEQLDRDMAIGPGSLRRTLLHILSGECVWLRRWRGESETRWPDEGERVGVGTLRLRFDVNRRERDAFLDRLAAEQGGGGEGGTGGTDLARVQPYRDSKGTMYRATLGDMLIQGVMHSKHHQAQAVNMLRRLGGDWPELDYMYRVRES